MKTPLYKVLLISLLISTSQFASATSASAVNEQTLSKIDRWQMNMIYQPSQSTLAREARGFVFIYDGFTDTQVSQIMDDKFDRIDNMMFTRVKITDTSNAVIKDTVTGEVMIEDDGCD